MRSLFLIVLLLSDIVVAGELAQPFKAPQISKSDSVVVSSVREASELEGWWQRVEVRCVSKKELKGKSRLAVKPDSSKSEGSSNQLHILKGNNYEQIFDFSVCKNCKIKGTYSIVANKDPLNLSWTQSFADPRLKENMPVPWARGIRPGQSKFSYFWQGEYLLETSDSLTCEKNGIPGNIENVWVGNPTN